MKIWVLTKEECLWTSSELNVMAAALSLDKIKTIANGIVDRINERADEYDSHEPPLKWVESKEPGYPRLLSEEDGNDTRWTIFEVELHQ